MDSDKWTDAELERLEKRIEKEYDKAQKELGEKAAAYFQEYEERFKREELAMLTSSLSRDEVESKWVDLYGNNAGFDKWFKSADHAYGQTKTEAENKFKLWEMAQLGRGQHWYDMRDQMAQRLTETNQIAAGYINGVLPSIYVANNNGVAEIAQDAAMEQGIMGVRFDLVDEYTVRNLMVESSDVRPYKPVNISIDESSKWSKNKLQNALLQGILQGDSIDHIADRFEAVTGMNRNAAIRNARTATTNAQNAGKQDRYNDLASKGCVFTKIWKATNDDRTRPEHWEADGQEVDYDTTFDVGGEDLMYPGDPDASGWNRYNCRCTMRTGKPTFTSILTDEQQESANIHIVRGEQFSETNASGEKKEYEKVFIKGIANDRESAEKALVDVIGFEYVDKTLSQIDETLLVNSTNQINVLESKFKAIHNSSSFICSIPNKEGEDAYAYVVPRADDATTQFLSFESKYCGDYNSYMTAFEEDKEYHNFMECAPGNESVYIATHEYGHMFLNVIVNEDIEIAQMNASLEELSNPNWYNDKKMELMGKYKDEIISIAKSNDKDINISEHMSVTSRKDAQEFNAEVFTNSQLGAPNPLGKAMNVWLERRGY